MNSRLHWVFAIIATLGAGTPACDCGATAAPPGSDGGSHNTADQAPVVTISAPADGTSYTAGTSISFTGTATDPQDGSLSGTALHWSSSLDSELGLGAHIITALVSTGEHRIVLTATDSAGNSGSASIFITITDSNVPVVSIIEPQNGQEAAIGESVRFEAQVTAPTGNTVANQDIVWTSNLDHQIGIGAQIRTGLTSEGVHTITCTATDSAGGVGSASITINVVSNRAPQVSITRPNDSVYFTPNDSIQFWGSASDPEDGPLSGSSLVWLDGNRQMGVGAQIATGLNLGDHTITFRATDSGDAIGEAQITLHIVDNIPPSCTINRPNSGAVFLEGASIRFEGSCTDAESGAIASAQLRWSSDVDNGIGTGSPVQTALTSTGAHVIALCATDPVDSNIEGCARVDIEVRNNTAPTCQIDAPTGGEVIAVGQTYRLQSTVADAEDPSMTGNNVSIKWSTDQNTSLATGGSPNVTFNASAGGARTLTLTVTDSGGLTCTAGILITVNRPPIVSITSVQQNGSGSDPFDTSTAIDLLGTASDPDGGSVSLSWVDSVQGEVGTSASASIASPVVGLHRICLIATDAQGSQAEACVTVTVLAPGQTDLFETFAGYNGSQPRSLAVDTGAVFVGDNNQRVRQSDPNNPGSGAQIAMNNNDLPDDVNAMFIDATGGRIYLATKDGLVVCDYSTSGGIDTGNCNTYQDGDIPQQQNDLNAVVVVTGSNGSSYLLMGNDEGLLIADSATGSADGTVVLEGTKVSDFVASGNLVYIATDGDGLCSLDPVRQNTTCWNRNQGAPANNIRAVDVDSSGDIWLASDNGLGRFHPADSSFAIWRSGDAPQVGLPSNSLRDVAVAVASGVVHDVVWIATNAGVSRLDLSVPSFTTYTTADGLPDNNVRQVAVLPLGEKIFICDTGVVRYVGP